VASAFRRKILVGGRSLRRKILDGKILK